MSCSRDRPTRDRRRRLPPSGLHCRRQSQNPVADRRRQLASAGALRWREVRHQVPRLTLRALEHSGQCSSQA